MGDFFKRTIEIFLAAKIMMEFFFFKNWVLSKEKFYLCSIYKK